MKIARILYPVHVLGPGERVAIWTYGCTHQCAGCANPELWNWEGLPETDKDKLHAYFKQLSARGAIEGITITGGDPFLFPESLLDILEVAAEYTDDILVYSGYTKQALELSDKCKQALEKIAVLIDGPYIQQENHGHVLCGSDNQCIYYLKERYREKYQAYIAENQGKYLAENFPAKGGVISVGIHKPDFKKSLDNYDLGGTNE